MTTPQRTGQRRPARRRNVAPEQLVKRCLDGEQSAWAELVREYTPLVWTVGRSFGLRAADREDVCQMVWARVVENLATLREPDKLSTWIATTARREAMRLLARTDRQVPVGDGNSFSEFADPAVTPEEAVVAMADDELARSAFRSLPAHHQELLGMLTAEPPMSYDQISAALAIPRGSIGPTRARILRTMRDSMLAQAS